MATRLLQSDVADFVRDTLLNVRTGLEEAIAQGIIVELPEKVDFQIEIIADGKTRTTLTETTGSDSDPSRVETTVEGASVDTETDSRSASQSTSDTGTEGTVSTKTYTSYTV